MAPILVASSAALAFWPKHIAPGQILQPALFPNERNCACGLAEAREGATTVLVVISDLHLTDGTSGETIRTGAFKTLRERFRDLVHDASWRSDDEYRPLEGVDLVLLGDIIDVIRSTRWCDAPPEIRPWGNQNDSRFADIVARITEDILANNKESLAVLKSLHDPKIMNVPPATPKARSRSSHAT